MRLRTSINKLISTSLVAALIVTAPGVGCWDAVAKMIGRAPTGLTTVPGGLNVGVGLHALNAGVATLSLPVGSKLSMTGTLPVLQSVVIPAGTSAVAVKAGVSVPKTSAVAREAVSAPRQTVSKAVIVQQQAVAAAVESLPQSSQGEAHGTGVGIMDLILGRRTHSLSGAAPVPAGTQIGANKTRLAPSRGLAIRQLFKEAQAVNAADQDLPAPRSTSGAVTGFLVSAARMAIGAAAVVGLNAGAIWLIPSIFGAMPAASVWAVSSGVILLPIVLYSRYRMGLRNSARLKSVKGVFDLAIGAFLGSAGLAVMAVMSGAFVTSLAMGLPALAGIAGVGVAMAAMSKSTGGASGWIDAILTWASLNLLAPFIGSVVASPLAVGGFLGLLALPALTTLAFFLGRIIVSAESGRPFSVPGSMKKIRFPAYTWVMTGVVFALLTGYAPVWTNVAFGLWMFLGKTRVFNLLWGGLGLWAAFTGFSAPVTFLFLAFAPERAAMGMEWVLGKLLKRGQPAPSTRVKPMTDQIEKSERWPKFNYWLKTGIALGSLAALGFVLSEAVLGVFALGSLGVNLAIAAGLAFIPFWFSKWLIKKMMRAEPMSEEEDPEVYGIMRELREEINESLKAKGKKQIPMPEMVNVPMPVPNAFATGRSPHSAMVGITMEMKDMTLNPERVREGLIRLVKATDGSSKSFAVFRRAVRGSLPDLAEDAAPVDVIAALENADRQDLKKLGVRALRGVMGHEFNHVMHRDMLLGAITGTISQGIAFSAYGVLWAVGHAQAIFTRLWNAALRRGKDAGEAVRIQEKPETRGAGKSGRSIDLEAAGVEIDPYQRQAERVRPQVFEPITTSAAATGILSLVKILVALWAPVIATLISMSSSRTREGHADEGGAILTKDPEALALGLGLLTSWRPPTGFVAHTRILPLVAAQAHIMTVNPIEQLKEADALPEPSRIVQLAVGKEDNFLFNLFITHPDTTQRIERLYDMAEAMAAQRRLAEDKQPGNNDGPSDPSTGSLRAASGNEGSTSRVDPTSRAALSTPGIDARLKPIVTVMAKTIESTPEKYEELGYLNWALERFLAEGGIVRYARPSGREGLTPVYFDPASKALFIHEMMKRVNPKLQAGLLASVLRQVYDYQKNRDLDTRDAQVDQILAEDAFFEGEDMTALAGEIDLSNPIEVDLFETSLQNRTWAASGIELLNEVFDDYDSAEQALQRGQDQLSLLKKQLADNERYLGDVNNALEAASEDASLQRQKRVLESKTGIMRGQTSVLTAQLSMLENKANGRERSRLDFDSLNVIDALEAPRVDKNLKPVIELMKKTIRVDKKSDRAGLEYLITAYETLLARGGRVLYAPPGDTAAAYFNPISLDIVIGREFANAQPELVAALLVHELTHAADYFGVPRRGEVEWIPRAMTLETERNAFTNEAIFAGAFDPQELGKRVDPRNPMEAAVLDLVYHARQAYVEGNTSLMGMISNSYTDLFGTHFEGLETASHLLEKIEVQKAAPIRKAYEDMKQRAELVAGAIKAGESHRRPELDRLLKTLTMHEASLTLFARQIEQLATAAEEETLEDAYADVPAPVASKTRRPGSGGVPIRNNSFFGPDHG